MQRYKRQTSCASCALDGKVKVLPEMPDGPSNGIMLLGEAPGAAEEAETVPFTGPSGRLLNWALKCSGIDRHRCWVSNTILCRPPSNDIGGFEASSAKRSCAPGLAAEIKAARSAGVRVIVALGETAMRALGLEGKPGSIRGSVYDGTGIAEGLFVIPTYHPSFLYRNNWTRQAGGSASHTAVWLADLEKAREVARPGWKRPEERFILEPRISDLEALWDRVQCESDLLLGVDIETTSLDPRYGEIVVVGLATSSEDAIVVPLLKRGPIGKNGRRYGIPYWTNSDAGKAQYLLQKILETAKQMYQNCFFDVPYLRAHGFNVPDDRIAYDSLLLHAIVSPETEHNLGFITSVYGQTPYWKDEFKNRAGSIFDMDESAMRTYNARDCVVLHQIVPAMLAHMSELNLMREWEEEVRPMIRPLLIMKEKGVLFDFKRLGAFKTKLGKILREQEDELRALGNLPPEFSFSSTGDVGLFLFGIVPSKAKELTSWEFEVEVPAKPTKKEPERKTKITTKIIWGCPDEKEARKQLDPSFRVLSARVIDTLSAKSDGSKAYADLAALARLLAGTKPLYLIPNYNGPRTSGGAFATDKDGLLSLRIAAQNRLEYLEALKVPRQDEEDRVESLLDFLDRFSEYKGLAKLFDAFTKYRTGADGRIHANWRFVSTGRLGCSGPNLQQCFPLDTEVLTASGWKTLTELSENQRSPRKVPIAMFTPEQQSVSMTESWDYVEGGVQPCVTVSTNDQIELTASSTHECLLRNRKTFEWKKFNADEYPEDYQQFHAFSHSGPGLNIDPYLLCLCVALQADGSVVKTGWDFTFSKQRKIDRFRGLLEALGIVYSVYIRKDRTRFYIPFSKNPDLKMYSHWKYFKTENILRMSSEELRVFTDEVMYWDGLSTRRTNYCSKIEENVDAVQLAFTCTGRRSRKYERNGSWEVSLGSNAYSLTTNRSIEERPEQEVACIAVPTGAIVIRQKGKVYVTGNCPKPKGDPDKDVLVKEIRRFFIVPDGWSMVSADFENAEVALLAYDVDDPELIAIYESGTNIHDANTRTLFGLTPEDPLWKEGRKAAKVFQFGGLSYGGGDREVHRKVVQAAPRLNLTFSAYVEAKQRWMDAHPKYVEWKAQVSREVLEKRIVYNEFGRARIFLDNDKDIIKEAMNFRIQSAGASILNRAIARIQSRIDSATPHLRGFPIMQIHDQLVYECPDSEVETFSRFIREEMTRPFLFKGRNRSLRIELSVGKTFGDLE